MGKEKTSGLFFVEFFKETTRFDGVASTGRNPCKIVLSGGKMHLTNVLPHFSETADGQTDIFRRKRDHSGEKCRI